jgi:hypothetical protein
VGSKADHSATSKPDSLLLLYPLIGGILAADLLQVTTFITARYSRVGMFPKFWFSQAGKNVWLL